MFNCGQKIKYEKVYNLFLGLSLFVSLLACKGEDGDVGPQGPKGDKGETAEFDNETRYYFQNISYGTGSITPIYITRFNINNYKTVDSISIVMNGFRAAVYERFSDNKYLNTNGEFTIELYDLTNKKAIEGSRIKTRNTKNIVVSPNFIKDLPLQPIDLGVKVIADTTVSNDYILEGYTEKPYLVLFRR